MLFSSNIFRYSYPIINDHDQRSDMTVLASFARSHIESTCVGVKEAVIYVIYHFVDFVCDTQF